jgi:O-methyltransferase
MKTDDTETPIGLASLNVLTGPTCFPDSMRTYNQDGIITMHDCSFMRDPPFVDAYQAARQTGSWTGPWGQAAIHWRAHVLCWAGKTVEPLAADLVECGVDRGGTAMLLLRYLKLENHSKHRLFLYDTFCGLDRNRSSVSERNHTEGIYAECYEDVRQRFAEFTNVIICRGSVPDSFDEGAPKRVALLHIDMNAAAPERSAIEFFWPRLVPGAIVKASMDEFAKLLGVPILSLPTGQGMLMKPAQGTTDSETSFVHRTELETALSSHDVE